MQREQLSRNVRVWLREKFEAQENMTNVGKRHKSGTSDPNQPQESVPVDTRACTKEAQEDVLTPDEQEDIKERVMARLRELMS